MIPARVVRLTLIGLLLWYMASRGMDLTVLAVLGLVAINNEMENHLIEDLCKRVKALEEK